MNLNDILCLIVCHWSGMCVLMWNSCSFLIMRCDCSLYFVSILCWKCKPKWVKVWLCRRLNSWNVSGTECWVPNMRLTVSQPPQTESVTSRVCSQGWKSEWLRIDCCLAEIQLLTHIISLWCIWERQAAAETCESVTENWSWTRETLLQTHFIHIMIGSVFNSSQRGSYYCKTAFDWFHSYLCDILSFTVETRPVVSPKGQF